VLGVWALIRGFQPIVRQQQKPRAQGPRCPDPRLRLFGARARAKKSDQPPIRHMPTQPDVIVPFMVYVKLEVSYDRQNSMKAAALGAQRRRTRVWILVTHPTATSTQARTPVSQVKCLCSLQRRAHLVLARAGHATLARLGQALGRTKGHRAGVLHDRLWLGPHGRLQRCEEHIKRWWRGGGGRRQLSWMASVCVRAFVLLLGEHTKMVRSLGPWAGAL
jgi:hypothetical protein